MAVLSHGDLLKLKRWNTPTIYNGWEQITKHDRRTHFNEEGIRDFMPEMGPMVGYAVTVVCEPSNPEHQTHSSANAEYHRYLADTPGPKIVVLQDLDKPRIVGSFWGEVNANVHKALGCVGTITDGGVRDLDETANAGFKVIANRPCVGHAYAWPAKWNCAVEVFGCEVRPGDLIHADKHGFLVIPQEDQERLLDAVLFMDGNECDTVIHAARSAVGKSFEQLLANMQEAGAGFSKKVGERFRSKGEW
jgi:regulator of RNase E activity RraA